MIICESKDVLVGICNNFMVVISLFMDVVYEIYFVDYKEF